MALRNTNRFGFPSKVVGLLDVDSFECQIYDRWFPDYKLSQRIGVMADQTGRIVSVTYPAKAIGITRDMRVESAKRVARRQNTRLFVVKKANDRDKPDGKEVRYACWEILDCLTTFREMLGWSYVVELSSCDEFYIDLTEEVDRRLEDQTSSLFMNVKVGKRTFLELEEDHYSGIVLKHILLKKYENLSPEDEDYAELLHEKRLLIGALLLQGINKYVRSNTRLTASVGVGGNKSMAKMAVSLNKPNGITVFPNSALERVGDYINIEKIPGFGGVFGAKIKDVLQLGSMNELARVDLEELEENFEEKGLEVFLKSKGIFDEPVKEKLMNEEVSCGKSYYPGQIRTYGALQNYFILLVQEMLDRLDEEGFRHVRYPVFLKFTIQYVPKKVEASTSRTAGKGMKPIENSRSWGCYTPYICGQSWVGYMEHAMDQLFNDAPFNLDVVKIVKMEVRAKSFEFF